MMTNFLSDTPWKLLSRHHVTMLFCVPAVVYLYDPQMSIIKHAFFRGLSQIMICK